MKLKIKKKIFILVLFFDKIIILLLKNILFFLHYKNSSNILFVNDGKLGDLIASSMIIENEIYFKAQSLYLVVNSNYSSLFKKYKGNFNIIYFSKKKFKYSFIYRICFILKLNFFKFEEVYNISPSRGFINEEITFLSGAKKMYSLNKNNKYLGNITSIIDRYYHRFFDDNINEYDKYRILLENFGVKEINKNNNFLYSLKKSRSVKEYILIAPFTSEMSKNYGENKFVVLIEYLSFNHKIIITGKDKEIYNFNKYINKHNHNIVFDSSDISEIDNILDKCYFVVGNDSAIIHIVYKLSIPMFVFVNSKYWGKYFPVEYNYDYYYYYFKNDSCANSEKNYNDKYHEKIINIAMLIDKISAKYRK